jgi:hypothetical protein
MTAIGIADRRAPLVTIGVAILAVLAASLGLLVPGDASRVAAAAGATSVLAIAFIAWPTLALMSFCIVMLLSTTIAGFIPGMRLLDEMAIPLLFLAAIVRQRSRIGVRLLWPREIAVALVFATGVLSSLLQGVELEIWVPAIALLAKPIAVFYIALLLDWDDVSVRSAIGVGFAIGVLVLVVAVVELAAPALVPQALRLPFFEPRAGLPAIKSVFEHPVLFAWFTAFVALFSFAHYSVLGRLRYLVWMAVFALGPVLAARRRAIIAVVVALALALGIDLLNRRPRRELARRWLPVAAVLVVVTVAFLPAFGALYEQTAERYLPDPTGEGPVGLDGLEIEGAATMQARTALYAGSILIARDHAPLGAGLGRYASHMSRVEYSPMYVDYGLAEINGLREQNPKFVTDTFWPQILGELGAIGLFGYAAFLAFIGWDLLKLARRREAPSIARILFLGAVLVFTQGLIESLASAMFHSPPRAYLLMATVGAALSMGNALLNFRGTRWERADG